MSETGEEYKREQALEGGRMRKFLQVLPVLVVFFNVVNGSNTIANNIASQTNSGYENEYVRVDSPTDYQTSYNFYETLYSKSWYNATNGFCSGPYREEFASNEMYNFNFVSCSAGVPTSVNVVCKTSTHVAFTALVAAWGSWTLLYILTIAGYTWFSYSTDDVRYYISTEKFKSSFRNKVFAAIGIVFACINVLVAIYYTFDEGERPSDQVYEIFIATVTSFAINAKMIHGLSEADYKNIENLSLTESLKDPIYIIPMKEDDKRWYNLWGGLITSGKVFYNLQNALLKSYLTGDEDCVRAYCKEGNNDTLEKILTLVLLDPIDDHLKEIQSEMDQEREWAGLNPEEKSKLWRTRQRENEGGLKDIVRRIATIAPVMLVFGNTLGAVMKIAGIAQATTYSEYPVTFISVDTAATNNAYYAASGNYLPDATNAVGSLADCNPMTAIQSFPWFESCEDDGIEFVKVTCPYRQSAVFIGMLSMWIIWTLATLFIEIYYNCSFKTNDMRYYLNAERFKFTLLSEFLVKSGYFLTVVTALLGVVYEATSDGSYWNNYMAIVILVGVNFAVITIKINYSDYPDIISIGTNIREVYPDSCELYLQDTLVNNKNVFETLSRSLIKAHLYKNDLHCEEFANKTELENIFKILLADTEEVHDSIKDILMFSSSSKGRSNSVEMVKTTDTDTDTDTRL